MKKGIEFVVYSNVWISLGAVSFAMLFYSITNVQTEPVILGFLFFSTLLTYNYQRFEKLRNNERTSGPRMEWMISHKKLVYSLLVVGLIGSLIFAAFLSFKSLGYLFLLGIISFFYVFKIKNYSLRDLPVMKILLIGAVWSASCFLIPYFEMESSFSFSIFNLAIAAALYIIAITIPFDIRDVDVDEKSKYTIPQLLGDFASRIFSVVILALSCWLFIQSQVQLNLGFWIGVGMTAILLIFASKNRKELYFSLGVDGLLVILGLGTYLLNIL
jgi:4-hydroxybenzoate polyprenyltransferase